MGRRQFWTGLGRVGTTSDPTLNSLAAVDEDNKGIYEIGFWVMAIITVITFMMLALARKQIRICVAIVKESTKVYAFMPTLLVFPTFSTIAQAIVLLWAVFTLIMISTAKPESLVSALSRAGNVTGTLVATTGGAASPIDDALGALRDLKVDNMTLFLTLIQLYGGLVMMQFVQLCAWCTMSGAVCYWYFFKDDPEEKTRAPLLKSLWRTLRYHIGSMAFAAFIIAIVQLIRLIFLYIEKQLKARADKNLALKLAFKCFSMCLWCLEKTLKYISYYGIVFVALRGSSFCSGCFQTFKFIVGNMGQASVNALVTRILNLLSLITIPIGCAIGFFFYLDQVQKITNPMYPTVAIFLIAMVIVSSCMTVFECTITTIFVCCFRDMDKYQGRYMSDGMRSAFNMPKKVETAESPSKDGPSKSPAKTPAKAEEKDEKLVQKV